MFRGVHHVGRMARLRRDIEARGGAPGSRSAPVAWSTVLLGCGCGLCIGGFLLPAERVFLLFGAPLALLGLALAVLEAILETR